MKFAFISTMCGAPWGGSEELWSHAAERLLAAGHEVHIGVLEWPARQPSMITGLGQTGAVLHMWPPPRNLRSRLKRKFFAHSDFAWLDKIHPDLLVISQGSNVDGVPCMLHALSQRIAYVPIAHMAASGCWPPSDESEAGARAYVGARLCCFVSEGNRRLTERQIAARLDRVEIVRNPFNVSYDANPAWPASNEPLQLACVGRLCADAKGQDLLLDVLSRPRWRDRTLRVRFFGDGPSRGHLQRLSNMLELESVDFAGHVGDIEHVWSQHHALVLASRFEGLPIALVEAMLCRRAALVTDIPGNAELISDGIDGFVAAGPNADMLDDAMERLWIHRDELRAMGQAAGESIRRSVPRDPVGRFVEVLLGETSPSHVARAAQPSDQCPAENSESQVLPI
jgi:glycosyltransferase involved in cell wall biosynthesis